MARMNAREAPVVRDALALLKLRGVVAWRQNSGVLRNPKGRPVRFGAVGLSDIGAVFWGGRAGFIECKRPGGGQLTEAQRAFLERARSAGAVALVISDIARLNKILDTLENNPLAELTIDGELET